MNQKQAVRTFSNTLPPPIGKCSKCHSEILASHVYAWCTTCNEMLPFGINMQRRPIMYGTIKVTPASFATPGTKSNDH